MSAKSGANSNLSGDLAAGLAGLTAENGAKTGEKTTQKSAKTGANSAAKSGEKAGEKPAKPAQENGAQTPATAKKSAQKPAPKSAQKPAKSPAKKPAKTPAPSYLPFKIGEPAPDFELQNADGVNIALRDLRGKWVALYFYPKDNTSGCTRESCEFSALAGAFAARGAVVVGASPDSAASHARFAARHELGQILLADESRETLARYGVWQEKSMYGRKYFGVVRTTILIDPAGAVARVWERVSVAGHAAEVLAAVGELAGE